MPKRITVRDAMLAAHIQYELEQYAPAQLAATVRQEITALYTWLGVVRVGDLLQPEQLLAWLRHIMVERPLPGEVLDFIHENVLIALELIQDEQAQFDTIVPRQVYDRLVDNLALMHDVRRQVTHRIVSSSVYSRLIANVLYHGIKSFLVSEHGVARTIPGAAAFVRLGQNALNAAAPQLEKNVDKQLLAFVDDNIQQLVADSELFLNRTLDEALIRKVGAELWDSLGREALAELSAPLDRQSLQGWSDAAGQFWLHLRTTQLFDDVLQAVVRGFFLRHGKRDVAGLLALLGLSEEVAVQELQALLEPPLRRALASGYLEQRIRARLEPFYNSYFQETRAGEDKA
jgi:hypothetical protein